MLAQRRGRVGVGEDSDRREARAVGRDRAALQRTVPPRTDHQHRVDSVQDSASFQENDNSVNFRMAIMDQKRKDLYAKQGYTAMFRSEAERDDHFRREIRKLDRMIGDIQNQINGLQNEIEQEESQHDAEDQRLAVGTVPSWHD